MYRLHKPGVIYRLASGEAPVCTAFQFEVLYGERGTDEDPLAAGKLSMP